MRIWCLALLVACGPSVAPVPETTPLERVPSVQAVRPSETRVLSILGTNDVHGHVETLAALSAYVRNLREERSGAVVLVDGGDMWQGTLPSNLEEGAPVVAAYNAIGFDAATLGNHEFDYGPVGPRTTPEPGEDRRGAIKARAAEARFAMLAANFLDAESGEPVEWEGIEPTVRFERAGVEVGVIGVSTFETPATTLAANVDDLRMAPLAETIERHARALRDDGAQVVIVAAHAGAQCDELGDPDDVSSCDDGEIIEVARALPEGLVQVIVAGHTHKAIAHRVNGIAVIESYALGRAFGRVDVTLQDGAVRSLEIFQPQDVCVDDCAEARYAGRPIEPDARVASVVQPAIDRAESARRRSLRVRLRGEFTRDYRNESAAGNLLADLILQARPRADFAVFNAGGVRANLPEGELTYGALFETFPFDNRFARVRLSGAQLKDIVRFNLMQSSGTLLFSSNIRIRARCEGEALNVEITRRGRPIRDGDQVDVVTSDYLATSPVLTGLPEGSIEIEDTLIREELADELASRGGQLDPARYYDASRPRVQLPMARPVECGTPSSSDS